MIPLTPAQALALGALLTTHPRLPEHLRPVVDRLIAWANDNIERSEA